MTLRLSDSHTPLDDRPGNGESAQSASYAAPTQCHLGLDGLVFGVYINIYVRFLAANIHESCRKDYQ